MLQLTLPLHECQAQSLCKTDAAAMQASTRHPMDVGTYQPPDMVAIPQHGWSLVYVAHLMHDAGRCRSGFAHCMTVLGSLHCAKKQEAMQSTAEIARHLFYSCCLMKDEGQHSFVKSCQAQIWKNAQILPLYHAIVYNCSNYVTGTIEGETILKVHLHWVMSKTKECL